MGLLLRRVPSALSERRWPSAAQAIPCVWVAGGGPVALRARVLTYALSGHGRRRSRPGGLPGGLFGLLAVAVDLPRIVLWINARTQ